MNSAYRFAPILAFILAGAWTQAHPAIPTGVATEPAFESAGKNKFSMPVWLGEIPGKPGNWLVAEKNSGRAFLLSPAGAGYAKQLFLHVDTRTEVEQGLLSIAFHPDFAKNRKYYVHYCAPDGARRLIVEEREMDASLLKDSGKPPRTVIEVPQVEGKSIHNGGLLAFGPDGMAYLSVGEGGDGANGQSRSDLLGNVLRIKIDPEDTAGGYRVPPDNPFVGQGGIRPEIWAYGFRNPWRMAWDMVGQQLWVGDVGQSAWEEIDLVRKGDNMGWSLMEGSHCNGCNTAAFAAPIKELGRAQASCIIGGMVFRGDSTSAFYGTYVFADHITKNLMALTQKDRVATDFAVIGTAPDQPLCFAADAVGNLYLSLGSGEIHRLVHAELKPRSGTLAVAGIRGRNAGPLRKGDWFFLDGSRSMTAPPTGYSAGLLQKVGILGVNLGK